MSGKLRVAVIGAGIAQRHLTGYKWNKDLFEVPVLCSLDEDRGRSACEKFGIPEYTQDIETIYKRDDIDIIDVCTPPYNHFELSKKGIEAGKHVICEKPLFGSLAEVDEMEKIVAASGKRLMPIFQYRWGMGLQKLKHLISLGLTGKAVLTTIETHWWRDADYYKVDWRGKWATEFGGGLLGQALHAHDMLTFVLGPCAEVFAMNDTLVNDIEIEDTSTLSIRMKDGSLAALSMTLGSREEISRLRFCFENLTVESIREPYTMGRDPWRFVASDPAHQKKVDVALSDVGIIEDGYTKQFELFHKALREGTELPVTLKDARDSLELITAAYYSGRTRQPVQMPISKDHPLYKSWLPS